VRAGDVIVAVNGKEVKSGSDGARTVTRLLRDVEPDSKVNLRVLRNGQPRNFEFVARPFGPSTFVYKGGPPPGPIGDAFNGSFGPFNFQFSTRSELAGLEVTALTPQLGRYFGTDKGMLVVRAPKGDVFKLQDGDVIVSIDGREPTSGSHITRILSSYQPGEQLTLRVMRDRKEQDIVVTLPEDQRHGFTRTTWLDAEA
jgi:S1-C subfamily serine protease